MDFVEGSTAKWFVDVAVLSPTDMKMAVLSQSRRLADGNKWMRRESTVR